MGSSIKRIKNFPLFFYNLIYYNNRMKGDININTGNHNSIKYQVIPISTAYIKPGESYDVIIRGASPYLEDDDYLVISETPIAISEGRIVDETKYKPTFAAILLADVWSKFIWGNILGPLFRIKRRTILNLRRLPKAARNHKQLILELYGWKHAFKPASEAGVDLSNVPGAYVSLLPSDPQKVVQNIKNTIKSTYNKNVTVMIIDTDATYKLGNTRFTSIPQAIPGIKKDLGIFGYLLGRFGKIIGPTPLAVSKEGDVDEMIVIAKLAEDYRKEHDNLETVYDMKETFQKDMGEVTVELLESLKHTPAIIIRKQ
jgi:F420-0:gamma-glutamyl ligase-like protein